MLHVITTPAVGDLYVKGDKTTLTSSAGVAAVCTDRDGTEVQESLRCSSFTQIEWSSKSAVTLSPTFLLHMGKDERESLRPVALLHPCPHTHPLRTSTEQDPAVAMGLPPNLLLLLAKKKFRGSEAHQSRTRSF